MLETNFENERLLILVTISTLWATVPLMIIKVKETKKRY